MELREARILGKHFDLLQPGLVKPIGMGRSGYPMLDRVLLRIEYFLQIDLQLLERQLLLLKLFYLVFACFLFSFIIS